MQLITFAGALFFSACSGAANPSSGPADTTQTGGQLPQMQTLEVVNISKVSAKVVGKIISGGGLQISERGVVWDTVSSPDIEDNHKAATSVSGLGRFDVTVGDLKQDTKYYVRAYAKNDAGIDFGDEVSFITKKVSGLRTQPNGEKWYDTQGNEIDAHAQSFIKVGDLYYMFGEIRLADPNNPDNKFRGFNCYSSPDLVNWTFRRTVLTASDIGIKTVGTRVDVIHNSTTGKYVMYFKSKTKNGRKYGLAASSTVDGHYHFIKRAYPTCGDFGDGTLYKEADGTAYLGYSCLRDNAAGNRVRYIYIDKLSNDYLSVERNVYNQEVRREAPQIFKNNGLYYMTTSGVTGWKVNQGKYSYASSLSGPWSKLYNFGDKTTYDSQGTSILEVKGGTPEFIFVADKWNSNYLGNSRYQWLPIQFNGKDIAIHYVDSFLIETN